MQDQEWASFLKLQRRKIAQQFIEHLKKILGPPGLPEIVLVATQKDIDKAVKSFD